MDNAKFGEALAKTMDRMERLVEKGVLDGYELNEVLVVAEFLKPFDDDQELEINPDALESLTVVDGTTQIPSVQTGILTMAANISQQVE